MQPSRPQTGGRQHWLTLHGLVRLHGSRGNGLVGCWHLLHSVHGHFDMGMHGSRRKRKGFGLAMQAASPLGMAVKPGTRPN